MVVHDPPCAKRKHAYPFDDEPIIENAREVYKTQRTDCYVRCGDEIWRAHRSVLSDHSSDFKSTFYLVPLGANPTVNIPEYDPKLVHAMMEYIYNGYFNNPEEFSVPSKNVFFHIHLHGLATRYEMEDLQRWATNEFSDLVCEKYVDEFALWTPMWTPILLDLWDRRSTTEPLLEIVLEAIVRSDVFLPGEKKCSRGVRLFEEALASHPDLLRRILETYASEYKTASNGWKKLIRSHK